jgi:hypothetical protein
VCVCVCVCVWISLAGDDVSEPFVGSIFKRSILMRVKDGCSGFMVTRVISGAEIGWVTWPMKSSVMEWVRKVMGSGSHMKEG